MKATMMEMPLTLELLVDRVERHCAGVDVVSRRPDRSLHRTTYGEVARRARRLARALVAAGVAPGDRVATLMWNHAAHLEAYLAIPLAGAVVHTLNLRLHPEDIAYIANDAGDRVLMVDEVLLPLYEKVVAAGAAFEQVVVVGATRAPVAPLVDYEALLERAPDVALPRLAETDALGICYSSGTTGRPKGVVYSHRSTILHSLVSAMPDALDLSRTDTLLPVVPMFHVNAWGLPYTAAMVGARVVFPGPYLDPPSLLELMAGEKVTISAGVPTIWLGIREALDASPGAYSLQPGLRMIIGGSAAPEQLIRDFDRQGLTLIHAWGMTETSPLGLVSRVPPELAGADDEQKVQLRARQGVPLPLVDIRVRNDAGDVPQDDKTSGELLIRGPWITASYTGKAAARDRWTEDGFFRTGDVARLDRFGYVQLCDRLADLIKSGGEWIATQELENALMCHPAVREAAVIGVAHPRWTERPIAAVVLKPGAEAGADELRAYLAPRFAKFWLPDAFVFIEALPRTSTGKCRKTELRERFRDWTW
jgi:fatty-acyl-CoA synthase